MAAGKEAIGEAAWEALTPAASDAKSKVFVGRAEVEYLQDERPDRTTRDEEPVRNVVPESRHRCPSH
eukprot:295102-Prymnesium_polylepis.1